MSSIILSLPEFYESYKKWVAENPMKASDYEITTKWISYFVAGRINNSHVVSELVYCLSNLLVFFNDRIITQSHKLEITCSGDKLKRWLTVLEHCEVFFELSARKFFGTTGKWLIIVAVQVFKCISRLLLIYHHKESIVQQPPIPFLLRREIHKQAYESGTTDIAVANPLDAVCYNLKRSGKLMRRIDATPPNHSRDWKPIQRASFENNQSIERALAGQRLIAETIYVLKPIVHLGSVACFGNNTWKPWVIALLMDLGSLHLYQSGQRDKNPLSHKQKLEISRRYVSLVFYLLRSPFYESQSRDRISAFLLSLSKNIPFASTICTPLEKYVPFWQSNYFYMWST